MKEHLKIYEIFFIERIIIIQAKYCDEENCFRLLWNIIAVEISLFITVYNHSLRSLNSLSI